MKYFSSAMSKLDISSWLYSLCSLARSASIGLIKDGVDLKYK